MLTKEQKFSAEFIQKVGTLRKHNDKLIDYFYSTGNLPKVINIEMSREGNFK